MARPRGVCLLLLSIAVGLFLINRLTLGSADFTDVTENDLYMQKSMVTRTIVTLRPTVAQRSQVVKKVPLVTLPVETFPIKPLETDAAETEAPEETPAPQEQTPAPITQEEEQSHYNCSGFSTADVNRLQGTREFQMRVGPVGSHGPTGNQIINHINMVGYWELGRSLDVLRALANAAKIQRRRPIFMDIGANIGYFSALAAAHNSTVYAFEPLKHNYDMIRCTRQHFPEADRALLHLFTAGAAAANTMCGIYSDANNPNDGHVVCEGKEDSAVMKAHPKFKQIYILREKIRTLRVDSLGIPAPDVVKIDVEGHEAAAFEGLVAMMDANPDAFQVIFSEFGPWMIHRKGYDPVKYLEIFKSRGYEIFSDGNLFGMSDEDIRAAVGKESIFDLAMYKKAFQSHKDKITDVGAAATLLRTGGWAQTQAGRN